MNIIVCGGREFDDWRLLSETLERVYLERNRFTVIHGDAKGADFLARVWAKYRNFHSVAYPAEWKELGPSAGSIRNQQMLDEGKPGLVIAFPGGKGTADMVRRAKKAGVEVIEVHT